MASKHIKFSAALALLLPLLPAQALEFRSVASHGAVLFDAPSLKAKKLYVASQGLPVEVLVEQKDWLRVRDQSGELAWLQKAQLSPQRMLQVAVASTEVRKGPEAKAPVAFVASKGLLLELQEAGKQGWAKVKHRDGAQGYIRIETVWGL